MPGTPAHYDRPGGGLPRLPRRTPRLVRGKPLRRIQREITQRIYRYPHRNLLVIAQPKSGSTWVWRMLLEVPGMFRWAPRSLQAHTLKMEGFHDLDEREMTALPPGYTATKAHTAPTERNLGILRRLGRPYVVLMRDPRDLAVSWAYFVANRPENAFHEETAGMSTAQRIDHFLDTLGGRFIRWAVDWRDRIDPRLGLLLRYEDLLADPGMEMRRVFDHYGIGISDGRLRAIVDRHTFERTTGRRRGEGDASDFFRKGVAGDWRSHFTEREVDRFKAIAGDALVTLGYEDSADW